MAQLAASGAICNLRLRCARAATGTHRCAGVSLVVVRDLSVLHEAETLAGDADMAVSFLYVVALGLDVVASAQLSAVSYTPARLLPSQCLRHARACTEKANLFVEKRLHDVFPSVRSALARIAGAPGSKIVVRVGRVPASGGVSFGTILDVVRWAMSVRKTLRELGPKFLSVDGSRLRT